MIVWRVWLESGRYVLVTAPTIEQAARNLTRGQRKALRAIVPVPRREPYNPQLDQPERYHGNNPWRPV